MRCLRFTLIAALALVAIPATAPAQLRDTPAPTVLEDSARPAVATSAIVLDTASTVTGAVAESPPVPGVPADPGPVFPIEVLAGAALATATRRKSGKRSQVPMMLDSIVHVMREGKGGKEELKVINGGVLVDDTDLSDDEVDELTARKVVRPATPDEVARLERSDVEDKRLALVREQEEEVAQLRAKHEAQRAELGDAASPQKVRALETKQGEELAKLQAQHAKALNKLAE